MIQLEVNNFHFTFVLLLQIIFRAMSLVVCRRYRLLYKQKFMKDLCQICS